MQRGGYFRGGVHLREKKWVAEKWEVG